jgi:hypothetical protein
LLQENNKIKPMNSGSSWKGALVFFVRYKLSKASTLKELEDR